MKLRIKDSSFRFRITLEELEELRARGCIECGGQFPAEDGLDEFRYAIALGPAAAVSGLRMEPFRLCLVLNGADFEALSDPAREGVYIRREWAEQDGNVQRAMVFVEKDRPGSTCEKPEEWIYREGAPGVRAETRAIPPTS